MISKNTICLWYDSDALGAARFYAETFPDSSVGAVHEGPPVPVDPAPLPDEPVVVPDEPGIPGAPGSPLLPKKGSEMTPVQAPSRRAPIRQTRFMVPRSWGRWRRAHGRRSLVDPARGGPRGPRP